MSFRALAVAGVFVLAVAVTVVLAQPHVTVVLINGQSYDGSLVSYRNKTVGVMTDSGLRSVPSSSVAVIEFAPGLPDPNDLSHMSTGPASILTGSQQVLVLQSGEVITGNGVTIPPDGKQITIDTSNGRNNYMVNDVARLYLDPSAAQRLMASNQMNQGNMRAVGTSGEVMEGQAITVLGNLQWMPTGIKVRQGEELRFNASGEIQWAPNQFAGPGGSDAVSAYYPVPTAGGGAVIARVANNQPFPVPIDGGTVTMPATGELYLGINDDNLSDNSGSFQVQIAHVGGQY